ncbi:hypothetical protein ACCO45_001471 [Purpureocillium lilacinum]|uniref:Uncharacterized protein n=1 Tax=Purpureocillium lilacinum TaxID=33203 RepID=A0ACC4E8A1_PURLI
MSALQRARSLRKPPGLSSDNAAPARAPAGERPRTASPSRLPMKPTTTATATTTSAAARTANPASATTGTRAARPASMHLGRTTSISRSQRDGTAASAHEGAARPASMYLGRTTSISRPQRDGAAAGGSGGDLAEGRVEPHDDGLEPGSEAGSDAPASEEHRHEAEFRDYTPTAVAGQPRPRHENRSQLIDSQPRAVNAYRRALETGFGSPSPSPGPATTTTGHYSPAKKLVPKPLTSTYLAPPSPSKLPANVAASAETSKLQAELLQLHLLHRDAAEVERFARLGEACAEVADRQRAGVERDNVLALRRWGSSGMGLDERIQVLDEVFSGVWALGETGGRYSRVVRRFERWIERAQQIEAARGRSTFLAPDSQDALFIGELDGAWKDECAGILRRLEAWRAQLDEIDDLGDDRRDQAAGTSLERMLRGARHLLDGMLAELRVMEDLEQAALAREDAWIEAVNREGEEDLREEGGGDDGDTPRAGAVWRVI